MAILVTGGAGYIGSVMVERLLARGLRPVVADNLSRGHREALPPEVPLQVGDVTDVRFLDSLFAEHRFDAVLHFAAHSQVGESMKEPGEYFRNNIGGVMALASCAVRHGTSRFILSSSAATYGDPQRVPIPEDAPTTPTNPYGESKLVCEQLLRWYGEAHGLRWTSLRYFNAAGASEARGEDHAVETHLIPLALRAVTGEGGPLSVFGTDYPTRDGTCVRDYVHVEDLADAHLLALVALDEGRGGIYNLGNGEGFSVLEVIRVAEQVTGLRLPWEPAPRRPGDPAALVASSNKARRELDWKPERDRLETIVATAWRWKEAHPHGYAGPGA